MLKSAVSLPTICQSIRPEILAKLNPLQLKALRFIESSNLDMVAKHTGKDLRKMGAEVSQNYLDRGILALKMYYALPVIDPNNYHAVSDNLDPFWHSHILFTSEYTEFSIEAVGAYMPHQPLDHEDHPRVDAVGQAYKYTSECLDQIFSWHDEEFFPKEIELDRICCTHGCSDIEAEYNLSPFGLFPVNDELIRVMVATA